MMEMEIRPESPPALKATKKPMGSSPSRGSRTPLLLLINPPQRWVLDGFASGLISIANHVSRKLPGAPVRLLDLSHVPVVSLDGALRSAIGPWRGEVLVGITTTTATYQGSLAVARAAKQARPEARVILGGHHATTEDEVILSAHTEEVDYVIRGEGERPVEALLRSFPRLQEVPGLSYRAGSTLARNPPAVPLEPAELDELDVFVDGLSAGSLGRCGRVTYVSARGCPLSCSFCSVARLRIRAKSIEKVIRDLEILVRDHGFRQIGIEDNFFAQSRKRTVALCAAIAELRRRDPQLHFTWDCQTRVESMKDADVVHAMAAAGCDGVFLGVESFHPEILVHLNKTRNPDGYLSLFLDRVLPLIFETKMACFLNLQFGTVPENSAHRRRDLEILHLVGERAIRSNSRVVVCPMLSVVYPGTEMFRQGVAAGWFPREVFEEFTRWEAEQEPVRRWLGRHFAHGTGGIPLGILRSDPLRRGEFEENPGRILEIGNHLDDLRKVEGIEVFDYEPYLVERTESCGGLRSSRSPDPGTEEAHHARAV